MASASTYTKLKQKSQRRFWKESLIVSAHQQKILANFLFLLFFDLLFDSKIMNLLLEIMNEELRKEKQALLRPNELGEFQLFATMLFLSNRPENLKWTINGELVQN